MQSLRLQPQIRGKQEALTHDQVLNLVVCIPSPDPQACGLCSDSGERRVQGDIEDDGSSESALQHDGMFSFLANYCCARKKEMWPNSKWVPLHGLFKELLILHCIFAY